MAGKLTFSEFAEAVADANNSTPEFEARLRRVRLAEQVKYYSNGTEILRLPLQDAREIIADIDGDGGNKTG